MAKTNKKASNPRESTTTPGGAGSKTTHAQYKEIIEWLTVPENFALINGGAGHGKSMVSGVKMKVVDGYRVLADHMNKKFRTSWDHLAAKNRFTVWKAKYLSTKSKAEGTGFGVTEADVSSGVTTVEQKLEKLCFMFQELDKLFGHQANVVPMHASQTNLPDLESNDDMDGDDESNAMDDEEDAENEDERNADESLASEEQPLAGDKGDAPKQPAGDKDDAPPPADLSAKPAAVSIPKSRSKTRGRKGNSTTVTDLSSDSNLDSASTIGKSSRASVSSLAAKPTRSSFAASYMESQVPKLDLMEKRLVARTKSAEATLALQREELQLKRELSEQELALKREILEQEHATRRLENQTKLKAERNAMLKNLLESGMEFSKAKGHVDNAFPE
ncbi:hypothetical protein BJ741DRAFT_654419 [Chytriomyces cf. hyalinus JEL632]|nr:hypothetical protein BJ741DRAFT_654419 [Chytriomyces cf. hyalinus JEL632]